ncbi:MAG: 2-amino-4-hydroxy-6-hydroxymethyldihydropteridine diphosphokinase [Candidatus Acidiferrales bacterium]
MKKGWTTVYLSLGANRGNRARQIEQALGLLGVAGVRVRRRSSLYETAPVGMRSRQWFLNCVVEARTRFAPLALLRLAKRIESALGRRAARGRRPADRPIDIDIVYYGKSVLRRPGLSSPHPRRAERRFVLEPLRELAPRWRDPVTRHTVAEMLEETEDRSAVRRLR